MRVRERGLTPQAGGALVVLLPDRVDELHLGGKQRRVLYTLEDSGADSGDASQQADGKMSSTAFLAQHAKTRWRQQAVNP